jgi:hypothetical protein
MKYTVKVTNIVNGVLSTTCETTLVTRADTKNTFAADAIMALGDSRKRASVTGVIEALPGASVVFY